MEGQSRVFERPWNTAFRADKYTCGFAKMSTRGFNEDIMVVSNKEWHKLLNTTGHRQRVKGALFKQVSS